ncbi:MAG: GGDEF domain-containing protein [Rhodoferax sp.]|nr:GGDEF domain-containing protein [Rhodoferax sp.]
MGDLLLSEVAQRLRLCVRAIDTVARFGGDEFVVMLSALDTDRQAAQQLAAGIAEKVRRHLAEPYHLQLTQAGAGAQTVTHHCTASIGVTLFLGHAGSAEEVLNRADAAMYAAKHGGRNQICFDTGSAAPPAA